LRDFSLRKYYHALYLINQYQIELNQDQSMKFVSMSSPQVDYLRAINMREINPNKML